ncbi:unnamed protein product [Moneuplotes crassus]|uniref:Glutathione S-transferase n=1 Tax=Euplotes crassus TaxID=5936 RepID=A0AAD1XW08_EUPCR|nr:unnamed protein product [Moneuplotes crassus]
MIKYWGTNGSQPCRSVVYCLRKLEIEHEAIEVTVPKDTRSEEFRRDVNPRGTIPTLEAEGVKCAESAAIVRYLCTKYDEEGILYPKEDDLIKRAQIDAWIDICNTVYRPAFMNAHIGIELNSKYNGKELASDEEQKHLVEDVCSKLEDFDSNLEDKKYLVGETMTIADVYLFNEVISVLALLKLDPSEQYKNIASWWELILKDEILQELTAHLRTDTSENVED